MIIITAALPYGNNSIHIGHIMSTFLPSDICARIYRYLNFKVNYISGMDAYGTPILLTAFNSNTTPQKIHDKYFNSNKNILNKFSISLDIFDSTINPIHHQNVQNQIIQKQSLLYTTNSINHFCDYHKIFLNDRLLSQYCSICNEFFYEHEPQCHHDTKTNYCSLCNKTTTQHNTTHYTWNFTIENLNTLLQKTQLNKVAREQVEILFNSNKLNNVDKIITRYGKWGVSFPTSINKQYKNLIIYVWIEALMFYSSFSKWNDPKEYKIQFMGKDNVFFHTYIQSNIMDEMPNQIVAGHFLKYKGQKMSKRNNANFALDELSKEDCDFLRFYLCYIYSSRHDISFDWDDFDVCKRQVIIKKIFNIFQRIIVLFSSKNINKCNYDENIMLNRETFNKACKNGDIGDIVNYLIKEVHILHDAFDQKKLWLYDKIPENEYTYWINILFQYKKCLEIILPYTVDNYVNLWIRKNASVIYIIKSSQNIFNLEN